MGGFRALIVSAFCMLVCSTSYALDFTINGFPKDEKIGYSDVYGDVKYKLNSTTKATKASLNLQKFITDFIGRLSSKTSNSYILTVVIKSNGTEIARRAIANISVSERRLLGFTLDRDATSTKGEGGTLLDNFPVTLNTNNLQLYIQIVNNKTFNVDTDTYNKFATQVSLLKYQAVQPAIVLSEALKVPLDLMSTLLSSNDKSDSTNTIELSFIRLGSNPNSVKIPISMPGESFARELQVDFKTKKAIVKNYDNDNGFSRFNIKEVLNSAFVGPSGAAIPIEKVLLSDKYILIGEQIAALKTGKLANGVNPAQFCSELLAALSEIYTNRDAPLVYAAYMDRFKGSLAASGDWENECITEKRGLFEKYKIAFPN